MLKYIKLIFTTIIFHCLIKETETLLTLNKSLQTWEQAQESCLNIHYYGLALNFSEIKNVTNKMKLNNISSAWIGYHSAFYYSDGILIENDLKLTKMKGDCVLWREKKLQALSCSLTKPFICNLPKGKSGLPYQCRDHKQTWDQALTTCKTSNGTLFTNTTVTLSSGFEKCTQTNDGMWIGIRREVRPSGGKISRKCQIIDSFLNTNKGCLIFTSQGECKQVSCSSRYAAICEKNTTEKSGSNTENVPVTPSVDPKLKVILFTALAIGIVVAVLVLAGAIAATLEKRRSSPPAMDISEPTMTVEHVSLQDGTPVVNLNNRHRPLNHRLSVSMNQIYEPTTDLLPPPPPELTQPSSCTCGRPNLSTPDLNNWPDFSSWPRREVGSFGKRENQDFATMDDTSFFVSY